MRWRRLFFENLWWKLLAFALAVMIWSGAQNMESYQATLAERSLQNVPIRLLALPELGCAVRFDPPTVNIEIAGDPYLVRRIGPSDPLVFVEVPEDVTDTPVTGRVNVRLPEGLKVVSVAPDRVVIRRLPHDPENPNP